MLYRTHDLERCTIQARDGEFGRITDLLFDDRDWQVRYAVADTRRWLPGGKVLIPRSQLRTPSWNVEKLDVDLTREQVRACPGEDAYPPLARDARALIYEGLHWTSHTWGGFLAVTPPPASAPRQVRVEGRSENHLRSAHELRHYSIAASDGDIGHVECFLVDDIDWQLRAVLIDTRNWLPGKHVVVPLDAIEEMRWSDRTVSVARTKDQIASSPELEKLELSADLDVCLMAAQL